MKENKIQKLKKIFPEYFSLFELPEGAHEEAIKVYRACRTGQCDKESFLPTYEERGFQYFEHDNPQDPGIYSLSTYENPKHIKRFAAMNSDFLVPYKIAVGYTEPEYGLVQRTSERKPQKRCGSHIDWWLYQNANPQEVFELIPDFEEYLDEFLKERDEKNES